MHFKLEKPDISKVPSERVQELLGRADVRTAASGAIVDYEYWTELKHKPWPKDVRPEEKWAVIKYMRSSLTAPFRQESVVRTEQGEHFSLLNNLPWSNDLLHHIDLELGGTLRVSRFELSEALRTRLVARGVMEEAIASSQIEGAHTTRGAAKQMLQEKRKPKTRDEKMILNNYQTMLHIEQELKRKPLTLAALLKMHTMLTEGTLDNPEDVGKLRDDEGLPEFERIAVRDNVEDIVYHMPPSSSFVKEEIDRLIAYANDDESLRDRGFMHPVTKAIVLHFWIGYLHPFADGNGRLARALFYWYLLRRGYWGFAYIPLSAAIKNSQVQYGRAYLYTEQDDNDLTYFVDYNLKKVRQAREDFNEYVEQKWVTNSRISKRARDKYSFNERQIQLLHYFQSQGNRSASLKTHSHIHSVSRPTALRDLHELEKAGFLQAQRVGHEVHYYGTDRIKEEFS